ncbi:MAG TPA: hypothetical protein VKA84_11850, partial [Gemmatimonadaceae bacterium]|nr:hypothetical protein [Gemmatimonadaceae bacterium]
MRGVDVARHDGERRVDVGAGPVDERRELAEGRRLGLGQRDRVVRLQVVHARVRQLRPLDARGGVAAEHLALEQKPDEVP